MYDVAKRLLGSFDADLAKYAEDKYKRRGIDLKMGHHVERVEAGKLHVREQGVGRWSCMSLDVSLVLISFSPLWSPSLVNGTGSESTYRIYHW